MKNLSVLLILVMTSTAVFAENFFQNTNPFPAATSEPKLNNIYEAEPAVMNKEQEVAKKANAKWWDRLRSAEPAQETQVKEAPAYKMINEGVMDNNSSFVVFPAK